MCPCFLSSFICKWLKQPLIIEKVFFCFTAVKKRQMVEDKVHNVCKPKAVEKPEKTERSESLCKISKYSTHQTVLKDQMTSVKILYAVLHLVQVINGLIITSLDGF